MLEHEFPGFSSPSWYNKRPGSFFCMHAEQLGAPAFNMSYAGGTTWLVVRREDRQRLDEYVVERAREWFDVPANVQLSKVEAAAVAGLIYTKRIVFHPDDLVAAGVNLTRVVQTSGRVVVLDGDILHFGMTTVPPRSLQQLQQQRQQDVSSSLSINEAVNFLPVRWLVTGMPQLVPWLDWLRDAWLPMQHKNAMLQDGKLALRTAMRNARTNKLIDQHIVPHWLHLLLVRLHGHLTTPSTPVHPTVAAIDQELGLSARAGIRTNIEVLLSRMEQPTVKKWLLKYSPVVQRRKHVVLKDWMW